MEEVAAEGGHLVPGVWKGQDVSSMEVRQVAMAAPIRSLAFGYRVGSKPSSLPDLLYVGAGPQLSVYALPSGRLLTQIPFAMPPGGTIYAIKICELQCQHYKMY